MYNALSIFGIGFALLIISAGLMYWNLSVQDPRYKRFTFWVSIMYGMIVFDIFMVGVYILEVKLGIR